MRNLQRIPRRQILPLGIVGSTKFGRYPKISKEETINLIISDGWLVNYAGYKKRITIKSDGQGRGIIASPKTNAIYGVFNAGFYLIDSQIQAQKIAPIDTSAGDVFMAENNASQIAICDKKDIWIYDYKDETFTKATTLGKSTLDFTPGYITYQDTYFIAIDLETATWHLSNPSNGKIWPPDQVGEFQSKADKMSGVIAMPSQGNVLLVLGENNSEFWNDTGAQLFPYEKNRTINPNYGCLNAATIAVGDRMVVWLGKNESSGPTILVSSGGMPQQIQNDGINYKFSQLTKPEDSYGFLFKQDGHLIYHIAFPTDNLSYIYDFNTQKFFTVTDENYNYHIAKRVVYFNGKYYFISLKDGNFYEMSSEITNYDGQVIPRRRTCPPVRMRDSSRFIVSRATPIIEQGENYSPQVVQLNWSKDGGRTFNASQRKELNQLGNRQNRLNFWQMGYAIDFVPQFEFWGLDRFVVGEGELEVYQ